MMLSSDVLVDAANLMFVSWLGTGWIPPRVWLGTPIEPELALFFTFHKPRFNRVQKYHVSTEGPISGIMARSMRSKMRRKRPNMV
jgi:hypothetical protein